MICCFRLGTLNSSSSMNAPLFVFPKSSVLMTAGCSSMEPTLNSCLSSATAERSYFGPGGGHFIAYGVVSLTGRAAPISDIAPARVGGNTRELAAIFWAAGTGGAAVGGAGAQGVGGVGGGRGVNV